MPFPWAPSRFFGHFGGPWSLPPMTLFLVSNYTRTFLTCATGQGYGLRGCLISKEVAWLKVSFRYGTYFTRTLSVVYVEFKFNEASFFCYCRFVEKSGNPLSRAEQSIWIAGRLWKFWVSLLDSERGDLAPGLKRYGETIKQLPTALNSSLSLGITMFKVVWKKPTCSLRPRLLHM